MSLIAATIRVVSRVIAPWRKETIPRRIPSLTVAVAPKSRNTIVGGLPASTGVATSRFPGCGSAWYTPSTKICWQ